MKCKHCGLEELDEEKITQELFKHFSINRLEAEFDEFLKQNPPLTATEAMSIEYRKKATRIKIREIAQAICSRFGTKKLFMKDAPPKVNGEYKCEHAINNTIDSQCIWCNMSVLEKIKENYNKLIADSINKGG